MKRLLGEQPERRPTLGRADSWAKKFCLAGKNKHLRRSSTAAGVSWVINHDAPTKVGG